MKILITGDQGFIGTNLTEYLKEGGYGYSIINPEYKSFTSKYDAGPSVDVNSIIELELAVKKADLVIHLAARKGSWFCDEDVKDTITTNTYGTYNVARLCAKWGVKLIHFGTTAYYDTGQFMPDQYYKENSVLEPKTAYGVSKLAGETLLKYIENLEYIVIRPVYAYGNVGKYQASRSESWPDVVVKRLQDKITDSLITDLGGEFIKDYTHISDICTATTNLMELFAKKKIPNGEVIQVGAGGNYLFKDVMTAFKAPFEILYSPERDYKGHQPHDYTKLKTYLPKWEAEIDVLKYAQAYAN